MVSLDIFSLDIYICHYNVIVIQELVYERPYMVLPPLIEWLRVTVGKIFFNPL